MNEQRPTRYSRYSSAARLHQAEQYRCFHAASLARERSRYAEPPTPDKAREGIQCGNHKPVAPYREKELDRVGNLHIRALGATFS